MLHEKGPCPCGTGAFFHLPCQAFRAIRFSYSCCRLCIRSCTERMASTLATFAPQKAKPRSRLPFMALISAAAMQYGVFSCSHVFTQWKTHLNGFFAPSRAASIKLLSSARPGIPTGLLIMVTSSLCLNIGFLEALIGITFVGGHKTGPHLNA